MKRAALLLLLATLLPASLAFASVRLPSPTANTVSAQGADSVKWDWDSVWGRDSYVLLLSDDDGQTWKRHVTTTSVLQVSGLDPCKTYIGKAAGIKNGKDGLFSREVEGQPTDTCAPPPRPKCDNGSDDDGDGFVDLADPGCSGAQDDDEGNVLPPPSGDPVVTIAGDIAGGDSGMRDEATADVIERIDPTRVLTAGDNAYEDGTLAEFKSEYDPSWGRFKARTWPTAGNHEGAAEGYFDYFNGEGVNDGPAGERGKGYYARDLGNWRVYGLNSNIDTSAGSAQEQWLRRDLAANAGGRCVMAYWHHPRYSSGAVHGSSSRTQPLWQALYDGGADLVVQGHEHVYERFAPQDAEGNATAQGMRAFTVGTGGAGLYDFDAPVPNSEVRHAGTHGVLKLALHPGSYGWRFEPVAGQSFTDEGTGDCHPDGQPPPPPPSGPTYALRGVFDRQSDGGFDVLASNGFSLIDSTPTNVSDLPAEGPLKALVWLGDYDDSSCSFAMSDATLTEHVNALKDDPRVGVWFISDEPKPSCPNVYAEHRARSDLIHSLDPDAKTVVVVDGNSGQETLDQLPNWKGTADHVAVDPYTCWEGKPCQLGWIDKVVDRLDASGITNYWGVIQAFEDGGAGQTMQSDTDSGTHGDRRRARSMTSSSTGERQR